MLSSFFEIRLFLKAGALAAVIAAFAAMSIVINLAVTGIVVTFPEWAQTGAYMLPSNTGACMSGYTTAVIAKWAYSWQAQRLAMIAS